jgi:hypothetical protein
VNGDGKKSRGGRTLPSEVCLATIAGGLSGRAVATATTAGPVNRKPRNCHLSHNQVGSLIAKCLPLTHVDCFDVAFRRECAAGLASNYVWSPDNAAVVVKTPVSWINSALISTFGGNCLSLEQCSADANDVFGLNSRDNIVGNNFFEVILMDCILKRREPGDNELSNTAIDAAQPMKAYAGSQCTEQDNFRYRTCIAILPGAGIFYCARERRKESEGKLNSLVPIELNWLHLDLEGPGVGAGQWFLPASYVQRLSNVGENGLCSVWRWRVKREGLLFPGCGLKLHANNLRLMSFRVKQCRDEEGPRLPPDLFDGKSQAHLGVDALREKYRNKLMVSNSTKRCCRHYAMGCLHGSFGPDVLIVDPRFTHDVDIPVSVEVPEEWNAVAAVSTDTLVQVRFLPALSGAGVLLDDVRAHAQSVQQEKKSKSARADLGDRGAMHPIGSRIPYDKSGVIGYATSAAGHALQLLRRAVAATAKLASLSIPAILRVIQDLENDSGMVVRVGMAGDGRWGRISHTMDLSVDLSNSSHYDVNDASRGFTIWTEDIPGSTEGWYFVLPNVYGKRSDGGGAFNGLAIRLTHGVLISWDGRLVRHGTSVVNRKGHVYGSFFAAKKAIVEHGQQMMAEIVKEKKEKAEASNALLCKSAKHGRRRRRHATPDSTNKTIESVVGATSSAAVPRKKTILTK